jgi:hypothetical protein
MAGIARRSSRRKNRRHQLGGYVGAGLCFVAVRHQIIVEDAITNTQNFDEYS